jgi:hypothetical protein
MENQKYMRDAAECALKFLDDYSPRNNSLEWFSDKNVYAYKLFRALAELTISDLDANKSPDEYQYKPSEIGKKSRISDETKFVNRHLNNLIDDYIQRHDDNFRKIAEKYHLSAIPTVVKDGSKGGPQNNYFIGYKIIDRKTLNSDKEEIIENISDSPELEIVLENIYNPIEPESEKNKTKEDYIEYSFEHIKKPFYSNWWYNYELSNFRLYLDAAFLLLAYLMAIIPIIFIPLIIESYDLIKLTFKYYLLISPALYFTKIKWDCLMERIIKLSENELECIATEKIRKSTGNPIRKIQLVSYWATCPICKEKLKPNVRIELKKGGKEFPKRLIGCCSESPTEHIYSFDRITLMGKPLRDKVE